MERWDSNAGCQSPVLGEPHHLSFFVSLSLRRFFTQRCWWLWDFVSPGQFKGMRASEPLTNTIACPPTNARVFSKTVRIPALRAKQWRLEETGGLDWDHPANTWGVWEPTPDSLATKHSVHTPPIATGIMLKTINCPQIFKPLLKQKRRC